MLLLKVISGSKAYGLDTDTSDVDVRSVRLESPEQVFGLEKKTLCHSVDTEYSFKRFMKLLYNGNPHALELLFIENGNVLTLNRIFKKHILDKRDLFLSKKMGVAYQHTAKGHLEGALKDDVPARSKNRMNTYLAQHALRLIRQAQSVQYLHTLNVHVSAVDRELLLNIRGGGMSPSTFEQLFWQEYATIDPEQFREPVTIEQVNEMMTKVYAECFYAAPDVRG